MEIEIICEVVIGLMISIGAGCAPVMVSVSDPAIQFAANSYFEVQFGPLKGLRYLYQQSQPAKKCRVF